MIKPFLFPFLVLSAIGLVLSLIVHASSLLGLPSPLGELSWSLHIGVFVVWIPAIWVSQTLVKGFDQKDFWKATLRGGPKWMKWMTYAFGYYAMANFAYFFWQTSGNEFPSEGGTPNEIYRGFSGHWMAFYSAALAILYSAMNVDLADRRRRCVAGHPAPPLAKFCPECGQPVVESEDFRPPSLSPRR